MPGFKKFVESDPAFTEITKGSNEASTALFVYNMSRGLPSAVLLELKDILVFSIALGYHLREMEGEKVPAGATIN